MSRPRPRVSSVLAGALLAASAVTAGVALVVAVRRAPAARNATPAAPTVTLLAAPAEPILAEADVFRTAPTGLAIEPAGARIRTAHPRNLETFRFIRAFPGAPPRIPHALSPGEFRAGVCRACHARGGYSRRFAAYVPLTPHPELGECQQCHVGEDGIVDRGAAGADPNVRCPMCHGASGGPPRPDAASTWPSAIWPALVPTTADQFPPEIPHGLELRGDCLACHSGPAAVAEIRTSHPERANCRQCHLLPEAGAEALVRPLRVASRGTEGVP